MVPGVAGPSGLNSQCSLRLHPQDNISTTNKTMIFMLVVGQVRPLAHLVNFQFPQYLWI